MIIAKDLVLGYTLPLAPAFSLEIANSQWVGVIGKNGCGKSTWLKSILGEIPPLAGELSVFSQPPGRDNHRIAYIPQEREINLPENMSGISLIYSSYRGWRYGVAWPTKKLGAWVNHLIALVGAQSYAHQSFATLSGGQKKRLYLAQALVNRPQLLLLDEPLADLDPHAKQHFIVALQKIHQQQELGLLIISHDMHEIAAHLDAFIHFSGHGVHYCPTIECVKEDTYVGI